MNRDRNLTARRPVQHFHGRAQQTRHDSQSDVLLEEEDDEAFYPQRSHTSVRRYDLPAPGEGNIRYEFRPQTTIPRRSSAQTATGTGAAPRYTEDVPAAKPRRQKHGIRHPVLYLGLGMFVMLGLWQGLTALGAWWQLRQDDSTYGRPRTAQYDVAVGHNDDADHPTHIIAINLKNRVVVIELPGGDTSKARLYTGPQLFGPRSDLAPVTLTFKDTTGSGMLDMIVHVQGADIVYLNQKVNNVWQFVEQQQQ